MKTICTLCLTFFAAASIFLAVTPVFAADCSPLYNGGVTNQQYCITPTPRPDNASTGQNTTTPRTPKAAPAQTKGGQRIYPSSQSHTTPGTGPEDWSLPGLFIIGALGFWLRKKTKLYFKNN